MGTKGGFCINTDWIYGHVWLHTCYLCNNSPSTGGPATMVCSQSGVCLLTHVCSACMLHGMLEIAVRRRTKQCNNVIDQLGLLFMCSTPFNTTANIKIIDYFPYFFNSFISCYFIIDWRIHSSIHSFRTIPLCYIVTI